MRIQVLYFEGCPNHRPVVDRLDDLIAAHDLDARVEEIEIKDNEQAKQFRFLGSPTVQVDGEDIDPAARENADFAMSCRVYDTPDGLPSRDMLAAALGVESESSSESVSKSTGDDDDDTDGCACCASTPVRGARTTTTDNQHIYKQGGAGFTFLGTVGAALLSSACCWLPMALVLTLGVSSAGIATFFETWRPIFIVVALTMLGVSFYLAYGRQPKCADDHESASCALTRRRRISAWTAAGIVALFVFYPNYIGFLVPAGASSQATATVEAKNTTVVTLDVIGMTCAGCEARAQNALRNISGVLRIDASHENDEVRITMNAGTPPTINELTAAMEAAGFKSEPK